MKVMASLMMLLQYLVSAQIIGERQQVLVVHEDTVHAVRSPDSCKETHHQGNKQQPTITE